MPTFGSLFAGIGGIDLGLERAGWECRFQVEIDPFCRRVLAKHWPNVTRYGDIREVRGAEVEPVDLLAGGFPCQDVSEAGKRTGIDGARSGLWSEFHRLIRELRPRYALVENVTGLLERGMGRVLGDLADIGYDAEWSVLSACRMGAPHTRDRVFILAHPYEKPGLRRIEQPQDREAQWDTRPSWRDQPCSPGMADGVSARMERCSALGNAVVPQCAEWIGRRLMEATAHV